MLFLIFLANVVLPQQTSAGLRERPLGDLQQAKASERAGGVFGDGVRSGRQAGDAAKDERALQSQSCDGTLRSFSPEKRAKNKGWHSPCQLVLQQTASERGKPGTESTEPRDLGVCLTPGRTFSPQLVVLWVQSQKGIVSTKPCLFAHFDSAQHILSRPFPAPSLTPNSSHAPGCRLRGTFPARGTL